MTAPPRTLEHLTSDGYWQNPSPAEGKPYLMASLQGRIKYHPELLQKALGYLDGQPAIPLGQGLEISLARKPSDNNWFENPGSLIVYDYETLSHYSPRMYKIFAGRPDEDKLLAAAELNAQDILKQAWQNCRKRLFDIKQSFGAAVFEPELVKVYRREVAMAVIEENLLGRLICRNLEIVQAARLRSEVPSVLAEEVPFKVGEAALRHFKHLGSTGQEVGRFRSVEVIEAGQSRKGKRHRIRHSSPRPSPRPAVHTV